MRLSHLVYALTLIAYAALQLGAEFYNMKLIWVGVIVATIIWIVEGLVGGLKVPELRRKPTA